MNGYYFNYRGEMTTGKYYMDDGVIFAFDQNGHQRKSQWFVEHGSWYYAGSTGRLYTGERKIGNKTYWFNDNGEWVK